MSLVAEGIQACRGRFDLAFSLQAQRGEVVAVVGASGAGKTMLLRCIAGLLRPRSGCIRHGDDVWYDGIAHTFVPAHRRDVGMVFAHGALFDHLTASENAAFGLQAAGIARKEAARRAIAALAVAGAAHLATRRAGSLSTGERQRVAIARAVALRPAVMLLDEPLANLDLHLRPLVREALRSGLQSTDCAAVLVTHEPAEAMLFARRFIVVENGAVAQAGDLDALRSRPATEYVASFAGTNLYRGRARPLPDGTSIVAVDDVEIVVQGAHEGPVAVILDPDAVALSAHEPETSARNHFSGRVESIVPDRGAFRVTLGAMPRIAARITAPSLAALQIAPGRELVASFKAVEARVL